MMIIKQGENSFHVFDVLGGLGVWELDNDGLERYLQALERKRTSSVAVVKAFPLLETSQIPAGRRSSPPFDGMGSEAGEDILDHGLPESCYFDTRIVREHALRFSNGIITPPSMSLDVNTICNYACRWCCADVHKDERHLSLEIHDIEERIVKPLVQSGNLAWYLVGGEPALTPERTAAISEMIVRHTSAYSSHTPFIALDSNGTAFEKNASLFKGSGINTVQFSLSSTNPEKDRYFRGCPGSIDPVETVNGAIRAAKSLGLHCGINMVLWKEDKGRQNLNDIKEVIGLGAALEVDFVRITPAVCTDVSAKNGMRLEKEDLKQVALELGSLGPYAGDNGGTRVVSMLLPGDDPAGEATDRPMMCRGGTCFLHVDHKGDVFPCAMVMPDFCTGNVVRDDLVSMWCGANSFAPWREVVEVCPECAACPDRDYCVGKCPAYAWFKFGNLHLSSKPAACPC